jgi:hypothetical protein
MIEQNKKSVKEKKGNVKLRNTSKVLPTKNLLLLIRNFNQFIFIIVWLHNFPKIVLRTAESHIQPSQFIVTITSTMPMVIDLVLFHRITEMHKIV